MTLRYFLSAGLGVSLMLLAHFGVQAFCDWYEADLPVVRDSDCCDGWAKCPDRPPVRLANGKLAYWRCGPGHPALLREDEDYAAQKASQPQPSDQHLP